MGPVLLFDVGVVILLVGASAGQLDPSGLTGAIRILDKRNHI